MNSQLDGELNRIMDRVLSGGWSPAAAYSSWRKALLRAGLPETTDALDDALQRAYDDGVWVPDRFDMGEWRMYRGGGAPDDDDYY